MDHVVFLVRQLPIVNVTLNERLNVLYSMFVTVLGTFDGGWLNSTG